MNLTTSAKLPDQYRIKKYNDNTYKLTYFKFPLKPSGYEDEKKRTVEKNQNDHKLESNISRTRSKIWEYAICNNFDFFITLTLDKKLQNRYDLDNYIKLLSQYIRNNRRLHGTDIQYLLIPEKHKDGAWHMHGLIKGIDQKHLKAFTLNDHITDKMKEMILNGRTLYNWLPYAERFGFVSMEKVKNLQWVSKYITKYIKKGIGTSVTEVGRNTYYVSRGLKRAELQKKGTFPYALRNVLEFDHENQYVGIIDLDESEYLKIAKILYHIET